jgi:cytochrome b6-f complex iron-sulfur subunit
LNPDIQQKDKTINKISSPDKISRRGFVTSALGLWGTVLSLPFLYAFIKYLSPQKTKFRSLTEKLNHESESQKIQLEKLPVNSSIYTKINDEPVIIIRSEGDKIIALSAICTHLDCLVGYRKSGNDIFCNCHSSSFNIEGIPKEGPAKLPLQKYKTEVKDGMIIISNS